MVSRLESWGHQPLRRKPNCRKPPPWKPPPWETLLPLLPHLPPLHLITIMVTTINMAITIPAIIWRDTLQHLLASSPRTRAVRRSPLNRAAQHALDWYCGLRLKKENLWLIWWATSITGISDSNTTWHWRSQFWRRWLLLWRRQFWRRILTPRLSAHTGRRGWRSLAARHIKIHNNGKGAHDSVSWEK